MPVFIAYISLVMSTFGNLRLPWACRSHMVLVHPGGLSAASHAEASRKDNQIVTSSSRCYDSCPIGLDFGHIIQATRSRHQATVVRLPKLLARQHLKLVKVKRAVKLDMPTSLVGRSLQPYPPTPPSITLHNTRIGVRCTRMGSRLPPAFAMQRDSWHSSHPDNIIERQNIVLVAWLTRCEL